MEFSKINIFFAVIILFALQIVISSAAPMEPHQQQQPPQQTTKQLQQKEYYLTRAWGEASMPFTVTYSNYARKLQQKYESTMAAKRRTKTTKAPNTLSSITPQALVVVPQKTQQSQPNGISHLFVSNGWGPMG